MPLGVVLAAAWIEMRSLAEITEEIQNDWIDVNRFVRELSCDEHDLYQIELYCSIDTC